MSALTFAPLPDGDIPAPSVAEIAAELRSRPGQWAVVYRADRVVRAQAYTDAVNSGRKFGAGYLAHVRKIGAECAVWASFTGSAR